MKRIELKIPAAGEASVEPSKTCLAFRFERVPDASAVFEEYYRVRRDIGLRLLTPVASEFRSRGYEIDGPRAPKKGFGTTVLKCVGGADMVVLRACPPDDGDQWEIHTRAYQLPLSDRPSDLSSCDASAWDDIRSTIEQAITRTEGVSELYWMSKIEAERRYQAQQRKPISGHESD
jgi:hypothetical protein